MCSTRSKISRSPVLHDPLTGVYEAVFSNGLKLLVLERPDVPAVVSLMGYRVGSIQEAEGETGMAHFLEHLMFKGSRRFPKGYVDMTTARYGGRNNAFTSRDLTAYYFRFPKQHWEKALEIEADRMRFLQFDPKEVEAERGVILDEIRMTQDSPLDFLDQQVVASAFLYHPYRHPILGWTSDVENMRIVDLRRFYQRYYHPRNAFLVLVGDLNHEEALRRVRHHFGRFRGRLPSAQRRMAEPPFRGERRVLLESEVELSRIQMFYHSVSRGHSDHHALDLASHVLAAGRSSRLQERLVNKRQIFLEVNAFQMPRCDGGVFEIYGQVRPGITEKRAERAIRSELQSLAKIPPSREELERARRQLLADHLFGQENILSQAVMIAQEESLVGFRLLGRVSDEVRSVTPEDISRVVRTYCLEQGCCVGVLTPRIQSGK